MSISEHDLLDKLKLIASETNCNIEGVFQRNDNDGISPNNWHAVCKTIDPNSNMDKCLDMMAKIAAENRVCDFSERK